ncbi:MAG: PorV/PorQ family protein [bacterium]
MLCKLKTVFCAGVILLTVALCRDNVRAQDENSSAGVFLRMGVGARAMSMGGAFVGMANDPSATYWNTAGLHQIRNLQFEFMNVKLPFDRSFNFFSGVFPVKSFFNVGISWLGLQVSDIESRSSNTAAPDNLFNNSQNAFFISLAKSLTPMIAVGGNVKLIRNTLDNLTATGVGFDASILFRPWQHFQLGLLVQNFSTNYHWNIGHREQVPVTYRVGAAWQIYPGFMILADINKTANFSSKYHFGGEFRPLRAIPIRLGLNDNQLSVGSGIEMPLADHKLEVNYAYSNDQVFNDAIHRVSLLFSVDEKPSQVSISQNPDLPRVDVETNDLDRPTSHPKAPSTHTDVKDEPVEPKKAVLSSRVKNKKGTTRSVNGAYHPGDRIVIYIKKITDREEKLLNTILDALQNKYQHKITASRFRKTDYVFTFVPESLPELKNVLKVMLRVFNSKRLKVYSAQSG